MQNPGGVKDRYGLTMSTGSNAAAEHYSEGLDLLLSQNFGAEEKFVQAIEVDEGFALAHAALAFLLLARVAVAEAKESAERARSLAAGTSRREQQQIEALAVFVNGENQRAYALVKEHLAEFPRDALLLRVAHRLFVLGCSGAGVQNYPPVFYDLMSSVEPQYRNDWAFLGQYAWANHEVGLMDEGLRLAERSLDLRQDNAVAAHSVAHVFFERADNSNGGDFLGNWLVDYDRRATYRVHLTWHQALFQLAMGRYSKAIEIYEADIRPAVSAKSYASLADSASLSWRMHIYGDAKVPGYQDELLALAAPASERPGPAFRDAHAALAFTAAGDQASVDQMINGLKKVADQGDSLATEVTLPLVQGIDAFGHGAYADAVRLMEPVHSQLTRVGGSHAQREVFEDTLLEACLRAEEFDKAEDLLRTRLKQRESVRDLYWLGRTQEGKGQQESATASIQKVSAGWANADQDTSEFKALTLMSDRLG